MGYWYDARKKEYLCRDNKTIFYLVNEKEFNRPNFDAIENARGSDSR